MKVLNDVIQFIAIGFLVLAFLFALLATWRFKKILIKLVALEVMVNLFISAIGIWVLFIHFFYLLDICIALSLIMFLSTAAYCQFLFRRGEKVND